MSENMKLVAAIAALALCAVLGIMGVGGMKSTLDGTTSSAQKQESSMIPSAQEQKQKLHDTAEEIDHAKSSISRGMKMAEDNADAVERRSAEHEAIRKEVESTMAPVRAAANAKAEAIQADQGRMQASWEASNK